MRNILFIILGIIIGLGFAIKIQPERNIEESPIVLIPNDKVFELRDSLNKHLPEENEYEGGLNITTEVE